jgi:hypothetical protein
MGIWIRGERENHGKEFRVECELGKEFWGYMAK